METAIAQQLRQQNQRFDALGARLARQHVAMRLADSRHRLQSADQRLNQFAARATAPQRNRLARANGRLEALSPLAVLQRGYALAYSSAGKLLRSSEEVSPQETIRVRLGSGALIADVQKIEPESDK
jgi:exodeoxyribonuclease VII large subunit